MENPVQWAAKKDIPVRLEGRGLFDCKTYTQPGRMIAHIVNLTATGRMPVTDDDLIPSGPLKFGVQLPSGGHAGRVRRLMANRTAKANLAGWASAGIRLVLDQETLK